MTAPPLCGIPVSVKDLYAVDGMPTYAGSARTLPGDPWSRDGELIARLRRAGAVFVGKTHTVEFAYGGVGINPHWGTPRNPWDADTARIPGGSSCGAGVSLWEGSAMLALGSDTGGSIRIPSAFTGVVGHKPTKGRLPTTGVTQLSSTFDTTGTLARTVTDSAWFFGCADSRWGDPVDCSWSRSRPRRWTAFASRSRPVTDLGGQPVRRGPGAARGGRWRTSGWRAPRWSAPSGDPARRRGTTTT